MHFKTEGNATKKRWLHATKTLLIMKLIVFFLFVLCFQVRATGNAQQVTLTLKNVPLTQVFNEIERQTGYHFFYKDKLLTGAPKTSVNVRNISVSDALNESIEQLPLTFSIVGKMIVIREKAINNRTEIVNPRAGDELFAEIKGIVRDQDGNPLQGVSVLVKGTTRGTSTKSDGSFSIEANKGDLLEFSMVGYLGQSIQIVNETSLNIQLVQSTAASLEDVVVIGYGTLKKSEVTGSIANVGGGEIANKPVTSFDEALNGRATGVSMTANMGVANSAPVFRIRGTNSLSLSSYPLIVVDGVPMYTEDINVGGNATNNPLSFISPDDIESIDIAKDAAATSIYGSRAANGVVFVTTKSGKRGRVKVSLNTSVGVNKAARLADVLNADQYLEIKNEGLKNAGTFDPVKNFYGTSVGPDGKIIDTRWYDYIFRDGVFQNHNLSVSGATDKTSYYFSVAYNKQDGIVRGNDYNRKSVDYNVDHKVNDWLRVGSKTNVGNNYTSAILSTGQGVSSTSANSIAYRLGFISAPIVGPYNRDGTFNVTGPNIGIMDNLGHLKATARLGYTNPVMTLAYNNDFTSNAFIQSSNYFEIRPLSWVAFKSLYGINNMYSRTERYFDPRTNEGQGAKGSARGVSAERKTTVWTNTLNANKSFGDHNVDLLLGEEEQTLNGDAFGLYRTNQTDPFYSNIQGGFGSVDISNTTDQIYYNYLVSMFSRVQYNYQRKYFFTANFRRDRTSVLGANHKSGNFWGLSGAWQVSSEDFWKGAGIASVVNNFKVNASYGKVGNVGGIGDYASLAVYRATLYGTAPGLYFASAGNPDLQWETSKKLDIGFDIGMFSNRLSLSFSYYKNNIDGLIFSVPVPASAGLPGSTINSVLSNVGSMYNNGVEVALNGRIFQTKQLTWTSNLNFSYNKNKVTALAPGVSSLLIDAGAGVISASLPGYPVGMIYAIRTDGVDPATGRRIFLDAAGQQIFYQQVPPPGGHQWEYKNGSEAPPVSTTDDGVIYKNTNPTIYGGFSNNFKFGNFDVDFLITYQVGGYMYFATQASLMDMRFQNNWVKILKRWQKPGDITDVPRVVDGDITSWGYSTPLTANVFKSDYARLKSLSVGYSLPKPILQKIKFNSVRIYFSGQNLALVTPYPGADPEVTSSGNSTATQGFDKNMTPNARTFMVGLQLGF